MVVFFRLLLLSLVSTAIAAPQYYNYAPYPIYPQGSYPVYPVMYPGRVAPPMYPAYPMQTVDSRGLITFSSLMSVSGKLEMDSTSTPAKTVEGMAEFHQNFATGSNSKYKIYLKGADMANKKYTIGVNSDCTAAGTVSYFMDFRLILSFNFPSNSTI